jgi:hypothetical protein
VEQNRVGQLRSRARLEGKWPSVSLDFAVGKAASYRVGRRLSCQNVTFTIVLPRDPRRSCPCLFPPALPKPTAGQTTLFFTSPVVKVVSSSWLSVYFASVGSGPPPPRHSVSMKVVNSWRVVCETICFCIVSSSGPRADGLIACLWLA